MNDTYKRPNWLASQESHPGIFHATRNLEECQHKLSDHEIVLPQIFSERLTIMETREKRHSEYAYESFDSATLIIEELRTNPEFFSSAFPQLTEAEKNAFLIASLASDVGKTGSIDTSPEDKERITEIYNLDSVPREYLALPAATAIDRIKATAAAESANGKTPKNNLSGQAADYLPIFCRPAKPGYAPLDADTITLRQVFDRHIYWTHDLFSIAYGDSHPATVSASAHHFLEGENPTSLDLLQHNPADGVAMIAKLTILLDKTNAHMRRGKKILKRAFEDALKEINTKISTITTAKAEADPAHTAAYRDQGARLYSDFNALAEKIYPLEEARLREAPRPTPEVAD